jgi:hypothetical protein
VRKFWRRYLHGQTRPIVDGRVHCELRGGPIDATECEGCPALLLLTLDGDTPNVHCRSVLVPR